MRSICLGVVAAVGLASCASRSAPSQDPAVIAPEVLDLPLIEGAFIPDDCQFPSSDEIEETFIGCVAMPLEVLNQRQEPFEWDYVAKLGEAGWSFEGGAANVLTVRREISGTSCFNRLHLIGWILGDEKEIDKYGTMEEPTMDWSKVTAQVLWFAMDPEPTCDS
ncbi:hypothetical protein [Parvularcula maris]|uniref:DUF3558 domain-containing protein n=1 Tax=Parvularcula maris TaxID=2965077 RepID=A0A9X2RIB8_9PROT|nr:hypothetical protein [Parvularcula maris]MCQ8185819.1 hypothetical protein [Parvularcula maris]